MKFIWLLGILCITQGCTAQKVDFRRKLNYNIDEFGLRYVLPDDFAEISPDTLFNAVSPIGRQLMYSNLYEIFSKKYNVHICFTFQNIKELIKYKSSHPNLSQILPLPNTTYLKLIDGFTDTLKYRLIRFPHDIVSKTWNANEAIIVTTNTEQFYKKPLFRGRYSNCKILVIHKENIADIFLYYWYDESGSKKIDTIISQTKNMIGFN